MAKWQEELEGKGWNSLFWNNHDLPRIVSRWGDDKRYRIESAKMLATILHGMQGTPYIYQGEELGMTNAPYEIEDYRDIELLNLYKERMEAGVPREKIMRSIHAKGRDNARTPMQWDGSENAGFTEGIPWIKVNPNYREINAERAMEDSDSVFHYYKNLIALRKKYHIFTEGTYKPVLLEDANVFSYMREKRGEKLLVVANFYGNRIPYKIPEEFRTSGKILIHNYSELEKDFLRPYEAMMIYCKNSQFDLR